jgi:hypothetical protein
MMSMLLAIVMGVSSPVVSSAGHPTLMASVEATVVTPQAVQVAYGSRNEITLFDSEGEPTAYIATDKDLTIYLWDGSPVAYLHEQSGHIHVYGFNGNHLGWFEDGIIWDHRGRAVGCQKGAINMVTHLESLKSLKSLKPLKSLREMAPMKPFLSTSWSRMPLVIFLRVGED